MIIVERISKEFHRLDRLDVSGTSLQDGKRDP